MPIYLANTLKKFFYFKPASARIAATLFIIGILAMPHYLVDEKRPPHPVWDSTNKGLTKQNVLAPLLHSTVDVDEMAGNLRTSNYFFWRQNVLHRS